MIGIFRRARADVAKAVQYSFVGQDVTGGDDVFDAGLVRVAGWGALRLRRLSEDRHSRQQCKGHHGVPHTIAPFISASVARMSAATSGMGRPRMSLRSSGLQNLTTP